MSEPGFMEKVVGKVISDLGDKKKWWAYRARVKELPDHYREAAEAVERYLMHFGPMDGPGWASMLEDLIELFEASAADATPIREIFGDDPVEFVETFIANYPEGQWRKKERDRFISAVDKAADGTAR